MPPSTHPPTHQNHHLHIVPKPPVSSLEPLPALGFLSIEGLLDCVPQGGYCKACFTGEYPVEIPRSFWEDKFLPGYEPNNLEAASATSHMPLEEAEQCLNA